MYNIIAWRLHQALDYIDPFGDGEEHIVFAKTADRALELGINYFSYNVLEDTLAEKMPKANKYYSPTYLNDKSQSNFIDGEYVLNHMCLEGAKIVRELGWRCEDERECEGCGLYAVDRDEFDVCKNCGNCRICRCHKDCTDRDND